MGIITIGIHSPGDMGEATASFLKDKGLRTVAALEGRSGRTRELAAQAGIEDVGTLEELVQVADAVLSILVPAQAVNVADLMAHAIRAAGAAPLYADCNAISPESTRKAAEYIEGAGGRFVDVSIVGPPPRGGRMPRFYASGPHAKKFANLTEFGLDIRVVGKEIGDASALAMCISGLQKGLGALAFQSMIAARKMGLGEPLLAEIGIWQPALLQNFNRLLPILPPKAYRFVGEMEEVASTHEGVGTVPAIQLGVAEFYKKIAGTRLGKQTPEELDKSRGLDGVIEMLCEDFG